MSTPLIDHFHRVRLGKREPLSTEDFTSIAPIFELNMGDKGTTGLLLIHGFSSTPASVRQLALAATEQGYSVAAPALAGFATQYQDLKQTSWQDWLSSVAGPLQQLKTHCHKIIVLGQSLGGCIALQLAHQNPDIINQLILLSPAVYPPPQLKGVKPISMALKLAGIKYWSTLGGDIKKRGSREIVYTKMPLNAYTELLSCMQSTQTILNEIAIPTTIFASHHDHVVPTKSFQQVLDQLGSIDKSLVWLDNSFHVLTQDNDAEYIKLKLLEQLASLDNTQ